jgi:hypothetical protein
MAILPRTKTRRTRQYNLILSIVDVIDFLQSNKILPGEKRYLTKLEYYGLVLRAKEKNPLLSKFLLETFLPFPPDWKFHFIIDSYDELSNCYYSFAAGHKKPTLPN